MSKPNQCNCHLGNVGTVKESKYDVISGPTKDGPIMEKINHIFKTIDNMMAEFSYLSDRLSPIINDVSEVTSMQGSDEEQNGVNSILYKRLSEIEMILNNHTKRIMIVKDLITL